MRCVGFEPFFNADSEILILGSFPSVKSREVNFYYGNGQNRFWRVLAFAYGEETPKNIEEKKSILSRHRIALWDMVTECDIEGSMDKDIRDPVIADVPSLVAKMPCKKILCNGVTSYALLIKNYPHLASMTLKMPSTSPANGRFVESVWIKALTE